MQIQLDQHLSVKPVFERDKSVLQRLLEFYQYDFAEYDKADLDLHGTYGYRYLDHYWTDPSRHAWFILVQRNYAGFVMVNQVCFVLKTKPAHAIAEYFIMRKYRRAGIGTRVAHWTFNRYPGWWEIRQDGSNLPSQIFWRNVVQAYTNGNYIDLDITIPAYAGTCQIFHAPPTNTSFPAEVMAKIV